MPIWEETHLDDVQSPSIRGLRWRMSAEAEGNQSWLAPEVLGTWIVALCLLFVSTHSVHSARWSPMSAMFCGFKYSRDRNGRSRGLWSVRRSGFRVRRLVT